MEYVRQVEQIEHPATGAQYLTRLRHAHLHPPVPGRLEFAVGHINLTLDNIIDGGLQDLEERLVGRTDVVRGKLDELLAGDFAHLGAIFDLLSALDAEVVIFEQTLDTVNAPA